MLHEREKRLLGLLNALGGKVAGLDFQKLLFLFCQEVERTPSYSFVPYRFGAFSFTSYADKRRMIASGLLESNDQEWLLTDLGKEAGRQLSATPGVASFCERYAKLRGNALVETTYRLYPYYATRSEMLGKLKLGEEALGRIAKEQTPAKNPGLLTIGYEGRSLEDYLNLLLRSAVTVLCDVRRNPLSRKYGFAKTTLGNACKGVGIRYEHLPELGIASEDRRGLVTQADYDALFAIYRRDYLPRHTEALTKINDWVMEGDRVTLTCYEQRPEQCHRHCVAEALRDTMKRHNKIEHL